MAELSLSNVVSVAVSEAPLGANAFNTSNLAIFTTETPGGGFTDDYKIYLEPVEVGVDFGTNSTTYKMALAIFSQQPNILLPGGYLVIIPLEASETLDAAITRTAGLVQYFGLMSTQIESGADMLAAAAVVQALVKMAFFVQRASASIEPGGDLDDLRTGSFSRSRGLYYGSDNDLDALLYQAAYAGRALSTVFSGSNTTQNLHLKSLATIQPDPTMTQTLLNKAQDAGADCYVSLQGVSAIFASGANRFFDQVYNLLWFVSALQIAGFNYLRQTGTKVAQTQPGLDGLVNAYSQVCQQAVTNQYAAPGAWNSPTVFGNPVALVQNILEVGYYIYQLPIAQQAQVDREARQAPLIQIALKEAGAVDSSTVVVNVNA